MSGSLAHTNGSDKFFSWSFQNNYAYTPESAKLPNFGQPTRCSNKQPLRQTFSQTVGNLVASASNMNNLALLSPNGPEYSDCSPITASK
jgi:hypothetical protein